MLAILPDFWIGCRLALRARLLPTILWLIAALVAIVLLAAQFSGRQPATVALDIGLSVIRLALPLVVILLVQELLSREFDRRYFLTSLTYPRPRHRWLLGRLLAVLALMLVLLGLMGAILAGIVSVISDGYAQSTPVALDLPYLATLAFIALDLLVVTAMAVFLAIMASTPSFVLIGTIGFMLMARSFANVIALLKTDSYVVGNPDLYQHSLGYLGYLLPDLGALDVRMIALYNTQEFLPKEWWINILSAASYALVLIALSLWALRRKRFN
jgi:ABC-type transport system involved in multi-copper enzyme maturation permease subunit